MLLVSFWSSHILSETSGAPNIVCFFLYRGIYEQIHSQWVAMEATVSWISKLKNKNKRTRSEFSVFLLPKMSFTLQTNPSWLQSPSKFFAEIWKYSIPTGCLWPYIFPVPSCCRASSFLSLRHVCPHIGVLTVASVGHLHADIPLIRPHGVLSVPLTLNRVSNCWG